MNSDHPSLYDAIDMMESKPGSKEAIRDAGILAGQAAGIALICSLALDSVAYEDSDGACDARDVAGIASQLLFKCWNDLATATNLMS